MTDDPRVDQLLEELLESGDSPEAACRACPELLPQVRAGLQRLRLLEDEVSALFPPSDPPGGATPAVLPSAELTSIRGYEVQGVLGRGGMGIVYRAWHQRLSRPVALKMLLAGPYARPEELERFLREAEAVAGLRHANIVQVYDVGDVDGRPYFTMELVEGGSLARKLAGAPLPAGQAAALVAAVAEAIQVAHQGGIIHRDLTPANVLLTADGTPKVSDFGLARRLESGEGLTLSGVPVGTPSYMAPEQARGEKGALGPATDVYALGAILYECLTGRPPFRAETATATLQQVVIDEPVPPARLNPRVPRDLETICLKCLRKEPHRRYASAGALAEDLERFERGEPIAARPPGRLERLAWWARRRPVAATLLAGTLLLVVALLAGWLWQRQQAAALARAAGADLGEVARLQEASDWDRARAALDRVEVRLGAGGPAELRQRVAQAATDLKLAKRLDDIRLNRAPLVGERYNKPEADRDYEAAFREVGLGQVSENPEEVAARIRTSAVHRALVAALDDWAVCAADAGRQAWLLEVARLADPDPEGWGDRVRRPKAWGDPTALAELARTAPLASRSVQLLVAVGERLQDLRGDSAGFLKRVQQQHPSDFWANFRLGNALCQSAPRDAVGYYRAALAARPGAVLVYLNLGAVLNHAGERDEAIVYYQRALELDPGSAPAHNHLAIALVGARRLDEALDHFRRALRLDPGQAGVHCNLAAVLETKGRLDEALDHYQQALRRDPKWAAAHHNLGNFLLAKGRVDEALDHLRQAAALEPTSAVLRFGLALALQKTGGRSDEAIANYEQALRLDPKLAPAHRNLGVALQASGRPEEALDHLRQAVALEPGNVLAHLTLARVLRQQGSRLDEAVRHGEQAVRLEPQSPLPHKVLGEVLLAQGRCREAEAATRRCLDLLPEAHPLRPGALKQLQRCAQWRALEDRLPAVLQGKDAPASDTERLQFAELCCLKRRYLVAAGLYAAAFDGTPQLAGGPRARHRYNAARAAAQAGCGGGDAAGLGDEERARWRRQARAWLRADVDAWAEELNRGAASARVPVRQALTRWREEPDVACVRDPGELGQLAAEERKECLALWAEVDALLARTRK